MNIVIGREYNWEMSHRLAFHKGLCKNIHGHSYKMRIELEGENDKDSMILDYYEIDKIISPILAKFDHSFVCSNDDELMINFLSENNFKYFVIEGYSTAENLVAYITNLVRPRFEKYSNIESILIRVYETFDAFAELKTKIR